jgi:hypothetical protein
VNDAVVVISIAMMAPLIIGGVLVILMGMYQRTKTLEMRHRERLAMIERGLAPGPETDPEAFEKWQQPARPTSKATSIGVIWIALGLGLMLLIGVTADSPEAAVGVGGAIVVLGIAFIVIGEISRRSQPAARDVGPTPPPPLGSTDRPGSFGR